MFAIRPAGQRGHFNHGWLDTFHTFSFGDYYDPNHTQFRALRVMNDDRIAPAQGFGMHGHRDMEIVTYILSGSLEHRDSLGNGSLLRAGELQRMTAGTGIRHSEFNPSSDAEVHLYQIWLLPDRQGLAPSYEQKSFSESSRQNEWQLVGSRGAERGSLQIHQDVRLFLADLQPAGQLRYEFEPGRHGWLQILSGTAKMGETSLLAGDGVAISDEKLLCLQADGSSRLMLFDLA